MIKDLSYWEYKSWLSNIDFTIIGSGIVGLNTALNLKERFPEAKILILERGFLPNGASTKNAGFACFGSLSEILDDLETQTETEVVDLVKRRIKGLDILRKNLGDKTLDFHMFGGYEFFFEDDPETHAHTISRMAAINKILHPVFNENVFTVAENRFGFRKIQEPMIFNKFEGQLDPGKMTEALLKKAHFEGIKILNGITVEEFTDQKTSVEVKTDKFQFKTGKLLIATNGFAAQLGISEVKPARAQVLITKPIQNLKIKGTFHIDKGYYYFRNIGDRILFGGGRNLDFKTEETTEMVQTELIQQRLENLLKTVILPETTFEIDGCWSGIMGVGNTKAPVLKQISGNVVCGVRLGGMGVAIGSLVGKELSELV